MKIRLVKVKRGTQLKLDIEQAAFYVNMDIELVKMAIDNSHILLKGHSIHSVKE